MKNKYMKFNETEEGATYRDLQNYAYDLKKELQVQVDEIEARFEKFEEYLEGRDKLIDELSHKLEYMRND